MLGKEGGKGGGGSESREINKVFHDSRKFVEGFHVSRKISAGWNDYRALGTYAMTVGSRGQSPQKPQKFSIFGVPNRGQKPLS